MGEFLGKVSLLPKKSCKKELVLLLPLGVVMSGCDNRNSWSHLAASVWMKPRRGGGQGSWDLEGLSLERPGLCQGLSLLAWKSYVRHISRTFASWL